MEKTDLQVIPALLFIPFSYLSKMIHMPLISSRDLILKAYQEGLVHFTASENLDKIIQSKELFASSMLHSYGTKKCFFFAGIPDFDTLCMNLTPNIKMCAVRIKLPYEMLAHFDYRHFNDGAIMYKGNLNLEKADLEKMYLGLTQIDGKLQYKEISKEEYENYQVTINNHELISLKQKMAFQLRAIVQGLKKEFQINLSHIQQFLKEEESFLCSSIPNPDFSKTTQHSKSK